MKNFRLDDEGGHQEALFEWAACNTGRLPELAWLHHIPNGGRRDKRTAVALKRQGVKGGGAGLMPSRGEERLQRPVHRA